MTHPAPRSKLLSAFRKDRSASVALLFAVTIPVMLGAGAFATDVGLAYLQRRSLQTAADSAALAAASRPESASQVARAMLDASGNKDATFELTIGNYVGTTLDRDNRFVAGPEGNAVRVDAKIKAPVYFGRIFNINDIDLSARSEAAVIPVVSIAAGSRLASTDPLMLNAFLKPMTGLDLKLSTADYKGLVQSKLNLGTLLKALAVDGLGRQISGTLVKDVISKPIKLTRLLQILSTCLDGTGDLVGGSVLRKASQQVAASNVDVALDEFLKIDEDYQKLALDYPNKALDANIGVLGMLNAAIGSDTIGNTISTGLTFPGLPTASVKVMVGEASQTAQSASIGQNSAEIQTDQFRMRAELKTPGYLDLVNINLNIPIELVVAGGTAKVTDVKCSSDPALRQVTVQAMPGVAKLALGQFSGPLSAANTHDRLSPAELVQVTLLSVKGDSYASIQQTVPRILVFKGSEIGNGTVKTAKTDTIASSLVSTLMKEANININVGIIGLPVSPLLSSVADLLAGLAIPLDNLIKSALATAGVSLGELDVRVDSVVCDTPRIIG